MHTQIIGEMRWFLALSRKLLKISPGTTFLVIFATLLSQLASLLAFFLPLKVLILLGSSGMPRYFPPAFAEWDRDFLVMVMGSATGIFYVLHLIFEQVIKAASSRSTGILKKRTRKLQIYDQQDKILLNAYQLFSRVASSGVFVGLTFLLLIWLYAAIAIWFISFLMAGGLLVLISQHNSFLGKQLLGKRFFSALSIWSSLGFLGGFFLLVADFLFGSPPGLIGAIIALLLSRQMFRHSEILVKSLIKMSQKRNKYEVLFFHNQPQNSSIDKKKKISLSIEFSPERRSEWIAGLANKLRSPLPSSSIVRWHDSGDHDVVILEVKDAGEPSDAQGLYLLIIYGKSKYSLAKKESELLDSINKKSNIPAPEILEKIYFNEYRIHLFKLPIFSSFLNEEQAEQELWGFREILAGVKPPLKLVQKYLRSHSNLANRINPSLADRLGFAANTEEEKILTHEFKEKIPVIQKIIKALPLAITSDSWRVGTSLKGADGSLYCARWETWALEPIGFEWPLSDADTAQYASALEGACRQREDLAEVRVMDLHLSALISAIEKQCRKQNYRHAIELLPKLLACLPQELHKIAIKD